MTACASVRVRACLVRCEAQQWGARLLRHPRLALVPLMLRCRWPVPHRLLRPSGGALLLADPPDRTAANRERFMQLVAGRGGADGDSAGAHASSGSSSNSPGARGAARGPHRHRGLRLCVKEQWVGACAAQQLDEEMAGGLAGGRQKGGQQGSALMAQGSDKVPVQLVVLESVAQDDTVHLKL